MTACSSLTDVLPSHWQLKRLKFIAHVQTGMAKGKDHADADTIEVPYLRVANVQDGYLALDDVATMAVPVADLERYRLQPGDVLMNEGGDFDKLGRGHVWHGQIDPCIHQNHVFAVRPHGVSPEWLNAWTGSAPAQFYFMGRAKQSTNLASISSSNVMELPVPVPPPEEQVARLAFIARETARIDALIAKKTRFIALLREKRQALVTQAVTRGLDPDVEMKDSGVEWLGRVPAHWEALTVRRIAKAVKTGSTPGSGAPEIEPEGVSWYTPSDFQGELVLNGTARRVLQQDVDGGEVSLFPSNSVLVVAIGATLGKVGLLTEPASANQQINAIVPCESMHGRFLAYSLAVKTDAMWFLANASTIGIMNQEKTKEIWLAVPPLAEQEGLARLLDEQSEKIDRLVKCCAESVDLLKEHRSALITATVTGQIDIDNQST